MKEKNVRKWLRLTTMLVFALVFAIAGTVMAAPQYQPEQKGSITLKLPDLGSDREGAAFALYQVGEMKAGEAGSYQLTADFASVSVNLDELYSAKEQRAAAELLMEALPASAKAEESANTSGEVTFATLDQGVYLVCQTDEADYGTVKPFLVFLPYTNEAGTDWNYDPVITPKAAVLKADLEVAKVDQEGNPLAGATLALYDANGEKITEWVTGTEPAIFEQIVSRGQSYTVKELAAPEGYLLAPHASFTVDRKETKVTLTVTDTAADPAYWVDLMKYVKYEGEYRSVDMSFYAALFWDKECTQRASDVAEIKLEKAYQGTGRITVLTAGTFYLAETDEEGNALDVISDSALFTNEISMPEVVLTEEAKTAAVTITNHFRFPDGFLLTDDASILIQKVVEKGGNAHAVTDTFYFTLYSDEERTDIVRTMSLTLEEEDGGEVQFENLAYGWYYLSESDAEGNPVGDDFTYEVSIEADQLQVSDTAKTAEATVVNTLPEDETKETDETEETEESESTKKGTTTTRKNGTIISRTSGKVKSGDNTKAVAYAAGMALAVLVVLGVILRKKSKKGE